MMFLCSFKITDKLFIIISLILFFPVYAFSQMHTQTYVIENKSDENQNNIVVETNLDNTIFQDEVKEEKKEIPANNIVLPDSSIFNNPYYYASGGKIIYTIGAYNKYTNTTGFPYVNYGYYLPYGYNMGGIYYDENGKKYYKTPLMPIVPNDKKNIPERDNSSEFKATIKYF